MNTITTISPAVAEAMVWLRHAMRQDRPALLLAAFRAPPPKPLPGPPPTPRPQAPTAPLSREDA